MFTSTSKPVKFQTIVSDGAHEVLTDAPESRGGAGAGFRPQDLLEAAAASCMSTVICIAADAHAIPLAQVRTTVTMNAEAADETEFEYRIELQGELTNEQRATLLHAVAACPVKKALSRPVVFKAVE